MIPIAEDLINGDITSLWLYLYNIVIDSLFEKEPIEKTVIRTIDFEKVIEDQIDLEEIPEISKRSITVLHQLDQKII